MRKLMIFIILIIMVINTAGCQQVSEINSPEAPEKETGKSNIEEETVKEESVTEKTVIDEDQEENGLIEDSDEIEEENVPTLDGNDLIPSEYRYKAWNDFTDYDFRDSLDNLLNFTIHSNDKFPSSEYMPEEFDPETVLEWGRSPVLGITSLHEQGITGKGVNIAYIDQDLRESHESIQGKNIHYEWIDYNNAIDYGNSMHGISVANLIVGDKVGAAPDVNLYFIGHPAYLRDQKSHSEAIYKVIEINETLPEDGKIKIIGFSDNPDSSESNISDFREAVEAANDNGMVVFFADNGVSLIKPYLDRDNPENYEPIFNGTDRVTFPTTYTLGNSSMDDHYTYWNRGGTSWTTPVQVSLAAMALQVDPNIDVFKMNDMMLESAYNVNRTKLVNPVGFIQLVKERKTR
ncbi:S8 family serine peptidase [Mycoplasmatota bacterium zrk1]